METSLETKMGLLLDWLSLQPEQKSKYRSMKNAYINATAYEDSNQIEFTAVFYLLLEEGFIEADDSNYYHLLGKPMLSDNQIPMKAATSGDEQASNEDQPFTSIDVLQQVPSLVEVVQKLEVSKSDPALYKFKFNERLSKLVPLQDQRIPLDDGLYKVQNEEYHPFVLVINNQVRSIPTRAENPDIFNICYTLVHAKTSPVFRYITSTMELCQLKPFVPIILIRLLIICQNGTQEERKTYSKGFRTFQGISQEVVKEIQRIICKSAVEIVK